MPVQGLNLRRLAAALGCLLAVGFPVSAAVLNGRVTQVIDGDSLIFKPAAGGRALEVRLHGLDAPESCQAGGDAAHEFLAAAVLGKPATLRTQGRDVYGRTLGVLSVGGQIINPHLVAQGHAWSARAWPPQAAERALNAGREAAGPYAAQESTARAQRRGVHAKRAAMPPWDFRRRHGPCHGESDARTRPRAAEHAESRAGALR